MSTRLCRLTSSAISRITVGGVTAPVGLFGVTSTSALVRGEIRASIAAGISAKSSSSCVGTGTGTPPHMLTAMS